MAIRRGMEGPLGGGWLNEWEQEKNERQEETADEKTIREEKENAARLAIEAINATQEKQKNEAQSSQGSLEPKEAQINLFPHSPTPYESGPTKKKK